MGKWKSRIANKMNTRTARRAIADTDLYCLLVFCFIYEKINSDRNDTLPVQGAGTQVRLR